MYLPLSPKQAEFLGSTALYRAFVGGRGAGKSWVGAYDLLTKARPWRTYTVADPTSVMLRDDTYPRFERLARQLGAWSHVKLTPYPDVYLRNHALVRFRSADDPERMRGPDLSGLWLNEASLMHADAFLIGVACLRECGEQGWLTATFTPKGPTHWSHEEFATAKPKVHLVRASTGENPFNPVSFESQLKERYGETLWARQELAGEFVALEGAEFPAEWFDPARVWFDAWPEPLRLKVIALDPSKGTSGKGEDYQAHVMLGVAVEDGRYVIYVDADIDRCGVVQMCERTVDLTRLFNRVGTRQVDSVVCEENGTLGLLQPALDNAAAKAGVYLPYLLRTNTDNKEFRIRYYVGPPLSRFQLRFRRTAGGRMLVGQLQSFPQDERDDGPDALSTGLRRVAEMLGGGQ